MNSKQILERAAEVIREHPALRNEPRWREILIADLQQLALALSR